MLPVIVSVLCCWSCLQMTSVRSREFEVGGDNGWAIPRPEEADRDFYNEWAAMHRFKINDTLRFKQEKDSVVVVEEEEEYDRCKASRPVFFSNSDDAVFRLDRPGLFYFISGVSGHCERGQRMIVKVLDQDDHQHNNHTSPPPSSSAHPDHNHAAADQNTSVSAAAAASSSSAAPLLLLLAIFPFLG
uniref:Phytocyanin domain-containing protein n=1 Tax=Kalanchoe fedtschenkoi TaxID=63787 RepID=A0A7N0TSL1_KALFE